MSEEGKRPQFGNRKITEESEIFKHNAWDQVEWGVEQEEDALEQIRKQKEKSENVEERMKVAGETASENWNCFYEKHENKFFKDRSWLFTEFERLNPKNSPELTVLELGCGNGSNVVPLLEATTSHQNYKVFGMGSLSYKYYKVKYSKFIIWYKYLYRENSRKNLYASFFTGRLE